VDIEPPLTLEQARQQLTESGWVRVYSLDMASQLAGYPVAMFTSIPEGFETVEFVIVTHALARINPSAVEFPYSVEQRYSNNPSPPAPNLFIMLAQSRNEIEGVGGEAEDVEIGSYMGKKNIVPMGDNPARLGLSWSDGTRHYVMEGTLTDPLDEAAVLRIAGSVRVP
jgi:hypothetical protein